jgi:hypothetical protein
MSLPDAQRRFADLTAEVQHFFNAVQGLPDTPQKRTLLSVSRALGMNLHAISGSLGVTVPSQITAIGPVQPVCPYCGRPYP